MTGSLKYGGDMYYVYKGGKNYSRTRHASETDVRQPEVGNWKNPGRPRSDYVPSESDYSRRSANGGMYVHHHSFIHPSIHPLFMTLDFHMKTNTFFYRT